MKPDFVAFTAGLNEGLKYFCQPKVAEKEGAVGRSFDFSLCKSSTDLNVAHERGVNHYCRTSGYTAGLQGKQLQVNCSSETIAIFNSDFQRGRTDLLLNKVTGLDNQLTAMRGQLQRLEEKNNDLKKENRALQLELDDTKRKLSR